MSVIKINKPTDIIERRVRLRDDLDRSIRNAALSDADYLNLCG